MAVICCMHVATILLMRWEKYIFLRYATRNHDSKPCLLVFTSDAIAVSWNHQRCCNQSKMIKESNWITMRHYHEDALPWLPCICQEGFLHTCWIWKQGLPHWQGLLQWNYMTRNMHSEEECSHAHWWSWCLPCSLKAATEIAKSIYYIKNFCDCYPFIDRNRPADMGWVQNIRIEIG